MATTFLAFIDESGDDGLDKFREPGRAGGGASTWLILSACIVRRINGLEMVAWRDELLDAVYPPGTRRKPLHFKDLNHSQKVSAATSFASKPIRITSILAAKRPIPSGIYTTKNQLYFYMARYLIERVSWFCRDLRHRAPEGDGRVSITFSRRGGMSADDFKEYMLRLRQQETEIHWPVIDVEGIDARDHSTSASLQFADIAASAIAAAVEPDLYGNCETRYVSTLKPLIYHRRGNYLSYGMKTVPPHSECGLLPAQTPLFDLFT